jgi:microcystin-dependent protein
MLASLIAALRRLLRLLGLMDSAVPAAPRHPAREMTEPSLTKPAPTPTPPSPAPPPPAPVVKPTLALPQLFATGGAFPVRTGDEPAGFTLGMVQSFAGPGGAFGAPPADGRMLAVNTNQPLMAVIGLSFGGDGIHLGLPNLTGRTPVGNVQIGMMGAQTLTMTYLIAVETSSNAPLLGMVVAFGGNYAPQGWAPASGQMLPISSNVPLYQTIGLTFGGNPVAFMLPDLDGYAAIGAGEAPGLPPVALGGRVGAPVPAMGLNYLINVDGPAAPSNGSGAFPETGAYLGQVVAYAGAEAPSGWLLCDGSLLDAGQYPALFALIGTGYGGSGQSFALPDLRGRILIGQ